MKTSRREKEMRCSVIHHRGSVLILVISSFGQLKWAKIIKKLQNTDSWTFIGAFGDNFWW